MAKERTDRSDGQGGHLRGVCRGQLEVPKHLARKGSAPLRPWKEPAKKVYRCYCHADAEDNSSEHPFIAAFAKGKHQTANHDCNEAQSPGDCSCECSLELLNSRVPRTATGLQED